MKIDSAEVLICGAWIIGLTIARGLIKSGCKDVIIIEKEETIGKQVI